MAKIKINNNDLLLFEDKPFYAFANGPVDYYINSNLNTIILNRKSEFNLIPNDVIEMCEKIYNYFSNYSNEELINFVHKDICWSKEYEKRQELGKTKNPMVNMDEYFRFYQLAMEDLIEELYK